MNTDSPHVTQSRTYHQPSPQQPNAAQANPPTQQPTMQTKRCNAKFYVGMVESHRQAAMQCAAVSSCLLELGAPLYKPLEGSRQQHKHSCQRPIDLA